MSGNEHKTSYVTCKISTFGITIDTSNEAFDEAPASEIAEILEKLAERLREGTVFSGDTLRDSNGNTVGMVSIR